MNELFIIHLTLSENSRHALNNLPQDFLESLTTEQIHLVAAAFVALDVVKRGTMAPKPFQLEVMLSVLSGRDCLVRAATGAGKTLAMILPQLLFPDHVVITVSPLKELHKQQAAQLNGYGIPTIAINEDTVFTPKLYQDLRVGTIKHIVTSPEQLTVVRGVVTRLGRLMHERSFTDHVKRVNIDECHFIKTAGEATTSEPPFRPAYGKLGDLRVHLGRKVNIAAFSATMPNDVAQIIMASLRMKESNTDVIRLSSNRPNLTYGVIEMVGSVKNFANVGFVVPTEIGSSATLETIPKGIIFIENKVLASRIAEYLNATLPTAIRRLEPIRHLHSSMSKEYNSLTFGEFAKPNGKVRILVATGAAAHGLDVQDLAFVVLFGVPQSPLDLEQKLGRCRRDGKTPGFAIVIAEHWAIEDQTDGVAIQELESNRSSGFTKKLTKSKRLRTEQPVFAFCRTEECKRRFLMESNHDFSATALAYTGAICCDAPEHTTNFEVALCEFFGSKLAKDLAPNLTTENITQQKRRGGRRKVQRPELETRLKNWLRKTHQEDKDYAGFPAGYILSSSNLEALVAARPNTFQSPNDLKEYIYETDEWAADWAEQIFKLIRNYDYGLAFDAAMQSATDKTTLPTPRRANNTPNSNTSLANSTFSQDSCFTLPTAANLRLYLQEHFPDNYETARNFVIQHIVGSSSTLTGNKENATLPAPASPAPRRPSKRQRTALDNETNKL